MFQGPYDVKEISKLTDNDDLENICLFVFEKYRPSYI